MGENQVILEFWLCQLKIIFKSKENFNKEKDPKKWGGGGGGGIIIKDN